MRSSCLWLCYPLAFLRSCMLIVLRGMRVLTNKAVEANEGKPLPLFQKATIGLTPGAIGYCIGSSSDLELIQMQADATLPIAQRRGYKNVFHALYKIVTEEGVLAPWKGAGPTGVRAMSLNMGTLASYDHENSKSKTQNTNQTLP